MVQPQQPPQPPTPTPPPPKPEVKPEPVKPVEPEPQPEKVRSDEPTPEKPKPHTIDVPLKLVHRTVPKPADNSEAEAKAAEKAAQHAREVRARAIANAVRAIKDNASTSTTIDMPGDSTVAYANYATIVKSVYTQAWTLPDDVSSDDANVKVSVTIANDGRVISAHITDRSGDSNVDRSVQNTLDRVTEIAPFPDGSTDKERTYIINFNLKAKRQMLG
jgi:TonB family protein